MKRTLLFSLACFFLFCTAHLQATIGGPDQYGYYWQDSLPYQWIDITQTGTQITGLADDNSVGPFAMNWSFNYYGTWVDSIKIGSNGWLSFDNPTNIAHCFPPIPTPGGNGDALLAPLMADLNFFGAGNQGRVYLYDNGVDSLIISYIDVPFWVNATPDYTGKFTFQVILSGYDNSITFQYDTLDIGTGQFAGGCSTNVVVGIESPTGADGLQYLADSLPGFPLTVRFSTNPLGFNRVTGTTFLDYNGNGQKDAGDFDYSSVPVVVTPGNYQAYSQSGTGKYAVLMDTGTFTLTPGTLPPYISSTIPASHSVSFSSYGNVDSLKNFALQVGTPTPDLCISLTALNFPIANRSYYLQLSATNVGTQVLNDTLELELDSLLTFVSSTPAASAINGNIIQWYSGQLIPGQSRVINLTTQVGIPANPFTPLSLFASLYPINGDANDENNVTQLNDTTRASYDPNDKLVDPPTGLLPSQAANREPLTYTIRFQNTGNAPAFRVELRDTLSSLLDLNTLRMLDASDPYSLSLNGNQATWVFDPILLPDSTTNEPESHGFVKFQIQPVSGLQIGDEIRNRAGIYFDFNPVVLTNFAVTPVDTQIANRPPPEPGPMVHIFPNPTKGTIRVESSTPSLTRASFSLIDLKGNEIRLKGIPEREDKIRLELSQFQSGWYILRILLPGGQESIVQKIKLEKE